MNKRNVALVLSSGGARGYAHIGAIQALEEHQFQITSVAGTSMGALVGGMYCAGRLDAVKERMCSLTRREVLTLIDWSLGKNHLMKGDKVIEVLKEMVPDVRIEDLPIPFRAVAAELETQREVVFSSRSLYRALRASISIPSVLKPIRVGQYVLVDGGVANPLPLNRVVRTPGDLLVSINVSAPASERVDQLRREALQREQTWMSSIARKLIPFSSEEVDSNYATLLLSAFTMMIQRNTVLAQKLSPPDIAVNIPMNRFSAFDFDHAERIIRKGYECTKEAIQQWEKAMGTAT